MLGTKSLQLNYLGPNGSPITTSLSSDNMDDDLFFSFVNFMVDEFGDRNFFFTVLTTDVW